MTCLFDLREKTMTRVKTGVVDNYIKKNPHAPLSVVVRETGCNAGTVYLARKRLGLPTRAMDQHAVLFDTITGVQHKDEPVVQPVPVVAEKPKPKAKPKAVEVVPTPRTKHPMELHHEEIARLHGRFAIAKAAIAGLSAVIVAVVVAFVVTFK
jgi:hypothetical protein